MRKLFLSASLVPPRVREYDQWTPLYTGSMTVRVLCAPGPTGHFQVGNVRTALYNWLFALKRTQAGGA